MDLTTPNAPVVSSISDENGSSSTDEVTNDQTLSISGTAEANSTVEVFIGGSSIGTTTTNGSGNWTYDYTGTTLAEGTYSVTATATDLVNNTSSASSALSVVIDVTAPIAPGTADLLASRNSGS